jgi:hypothetical protein
LWWNSIITTITTTVIAGTAITIVTAGESVTNKVPGELGAFSWLLLYRRGPGNMVMIS